MTHRTSTAAALALCLAFACSKQKADRDSRIGRSDASEELVPASRTLDSEPARANPEPADEPGTASEGSESEIAPEPPATSAPTATALETEREFSRTPDVIYVPTPQPVVDKMLELAKVTKDDLVYDLGCGDGRIVVTAAQRYKARAIGFDIDPQRVREARENVRKNGVEDLVTIEQRDIFELDLTPATVVTLYLLPELNDKLRPQLEKLRPGSRVVSHDFDMTGVVPVTYLEIQPSGVDRKHEIFFWTIPFKKKAPLPKPIVGPAPVPP